jgi:hypothetical protein
MGAMRPSVEAIVMVNPAYTEYQKYLVAQKANAKQLVVQILKSPAAKKIDFWLGSIHVNAVGLNLVVNAVNNGIIDLKIGPVNAGAAAMYGNRENAYTFPSTAVLSTPSGRTDVLHESVHAMQDVGGGKVISERGSMFGTESENEAAAYVAGALFEIYSGSKVPPSTLNVFVKAWSIAQSLQDTPGAIVPKLDADQLRIMIVMHPVYMFSSSNISFTTPTFGNGVQ